MNLEADILWAPIKEDGGHAKHFQRAPWWDYFWKIGIGAFWPTKAVEWGFSKGKSSEGRAKVLHGPRTQTYGKTNNSWQVSKC